MWVMVGVVGHCGLWEEWSVTVGCGRSGEVLLVVVEVVGHYRLWQLWSVNEGCGRSGQSL